MKVEKNKQRARNMLQWLAAGDFKRLHRALSDQFWIRTARPRRFMRESRLLAWRQRAVLGKLLRTYYGIGLSDKGRVLNVALILRDGATIPRSSAFIRLISPLTDPSLGGKVGLSLHGENTTAVGEGTDVCVVQRTAFDSETAARQLAANLAAQQVALVVDNDDAFHAIDHSHPEHQAQQKRVAALDYLIQEADQVWLSVPKLTPEAAAAKGKVVVVANSLDRRLWRQAAKTRQDADAPISMVYMGTGTHDADLRLILPALDAVAAAHPDSFSLTIIGVAEDLPQRSWIRRLAPPATIYPVFTSWFTTKGPFDLGLSPLVGSEFNQAKSDIKCLDYLASGTVPVVSDVLPYQTPELQAFIIKVKNTPEAWAASLAAMVQDPRAFRAKSAQLMPRAQDYLWTKRSSPVVARQLFDLLQHLKK